MKKSLTVAILIAAVVAAGCEKNGPEKKTYTAELTSVSILAEDNAEILSEDIDVPVENSMAVRLAGGGRDKELVLTLVAGKDDAIFIDEEEVIGGKAKIDASFPVDIIVRDTVGNITTAYELKVKNTAGMTIDFVKRWAEPDCENNMDSDLGMAVTADGGAYISYLRKATVGETTDKYYSLAVAKWNGTDFSVVGGGPVIESADRSVSDPVSIAVKNDGTPIVMYKGGQVKDFISVKEFKGGKWEFVGTDAGISTRFTSSFGLPMFYFNPQTGNPGFFYTSNLSSDPTNYRNYAEAVFDGAAWSLNYSSLPDYPKYKQLGTDSDGMFYMASACNTKDAAWIVTSSNQWGYYVYKMTGSAWEPVVVNFKPEGEDYGVGGNLSIKADENGDIYVFAACSKNPRMQFYKVNEGSKTLDPVGSAFTCSAGSYGAIAELAGFAVSKAGQAVAVVDDTFYVLDENKQWQMACKVPFNGTVKSQYFMDFTDADSGIFAVMVQDAEKKNAINVYKFGPEE